MEHMKEPVRSLCTLFHPIQPSANSSTSSGHEPSSHMEQRGKEEELLALKVSLTQLKLEELKVWQKNSFSRFLLFLLI